MKYSVVTTFNAAGYEKYGQRMIQTFIKNWPNDVELLVYAEDCTVTESAANLKVFDLNASSPDLVAFKQRWQGVPKANGDVSQDPVRSKRKDGGKGFKWDAVRFSHKVYAIFAAAKQSAADYLIWMDADMVCHSPVSQEFLQNMLSRDVCFLGRPGKYTECGLYAINLKTDAGQRFLHQFQHYYDQDTIFEFAEWHDSFVFDRVRDSVQCEETDWAAELGPGIGHPLINSAWGAYLDHLKGARKDAGRSKAKDLRVQRKERYWA